MKYNCGKCCERDWDISVTEAEIQRWAKSRPELLKEIISKVTDNKIKKVLRKKSIQFPDGKIRKVCVFYDFDKKCTIYKDRPEICKKFTCLGHPLFVFQLFKNLTFFMANCSPTSEGTNGS